MSFFNNSMLPGWEVPHDASEQELSSNTGSNEWQDSFHMDQDSLQQSIDDFLDEWQSQSQTTHGEVRQNVDAVDTSQPDLVHANPAGSEYTLDTNEIYSQQPPFSGEQGSLRDANRNNFDVDGKKEHNSETSPSLTLFQTTCHRKKECDRNTNLVLRSTILTRHCLQRTWCKDEL